jgi:hypothetical protein
MRMSSSKKKALAVGFWAAIAAVGVVFIGLYLLTALALIAAGFWPWLAWVWFVLYTGWFVFKVGSVAVTKWIELRSILG